MSENNISEKKDKKKNQWIVYRLILQLIIFVIFIWIILYYILPNIKEIEAHKSGLSEKIASYESIEKNWIEFSDFNSLKNSVELELWESLKEDIYLSNILADIKKDFFDYNFKSDNNNINYKIFLDKKYEETIKKKTSQKVVQRDSKIKKVLPAYIENDKLIEDEEWILTDFKFVNYLELLLDTFNLESSIEFGIWNLNAVNFSDENDDKKNKKQDWLESKIYYIPIEFDIKWQKRDIIRFIHFFENVWSVDIDDNNNISIFSDKVLQNININNSLSKDMNPYESQVADIASITMNEYIDSSSTARETDLYTFIIEDQADEEYEVGITIRFYAKWLPSYKIEFYINGVISKYKELKKDVSKLLKEVSNSKFKRMSWSSANISNETKSISDYLNGLDKNIIWYEKSLKKVWWLDSIYEKIQDLDEKLEIVSDIYEKNRKLTNDILKNNNK